MRTYFPRIAHGLFSLVVVLLLAACGGGGTRGVCDPITNNHQWRVQYLSVTNDKNLPVAHNPALMVYVCPTFP